MSQNETIAKAGAENAQKTGRGSIKPLPTQEKLKEAFDDAVAWRKDMEAQRAHILGLAA